MHSLAWSAYKLACFRAKIDPDRVTQTVGTAKASAGFHKADGTFINEKGQAEPYTAAVDLHCTDLSTAQINRLQVEMFHAGFFPFWRHTGSFADNQHLHCVYLAVHMKAQLQGQVHDGFRGKDGLADHEADPFFLSRLSDPAIEHNWQLFLHANPQ